MHLGFMGLQRWARSLARLYQTGIVNAWTSSNYDQPWIQVWKGGLGVGDVMGECGCLCWGTPWEGLEQGSGSKGAVPTGEVSFKWRAALSLGGWDGKG